MATLEWQLTSDSPEATQKLAQELAHALKPGTIIALIGDLGAGKTHFVQGLAKGLGVYNQSEVVSPTYTLVNIYDGARLNLVHIDLYRLDEGAAVHDLGIEEELYRNDALIAVEWADKFPTLFADDTVWIELRDPGDNTREIRVRGCKRPST